MIKIENVEIVGLEHAIRGMRNPKNSWDKSDSGYEMVYEDGGIKDVEYQVGPKDLKLMKTLVKAGTDHRKFMRMIAVYVDITAPLYWWKEFDTYKVGTVANSCSTMHKIQDKEFTFDDFSCEHLAYFDCGNGIVPMGVLNYTIICLNMCRLLYLETKDKIYWWQMIQLLPSSYNQKRTIMLNYEVLANMYKSRKNHKLNEWQTFCKWIESLPYAKELIICD